MDQDRLERLVAPAVVGRDLERLAESFGGLVVAREPLLEDAGALEQERAARFGLGLARASRIAREVRPALGCPIAAVERLLGFLALG